MGEPIHVAVVIIDPSVEEKIRHRAGGGCTGDEIREAFVLRADADLRWEDDPEHGRRVIGIGFTYAGRELMAALLPQDPGDGLWVLKTARAL